MTDSQKNNDPVSVQRGIYTRSLSSILIFSLGRAVSAPLQYTLIRKHPLGYFGISRPPLGPSLNLPLFGSVPRTIALVVFMPAFLSLKHIIWANFFMKEHMTIPFAFAGVTMDLLYETLSTLVFTAAAINPMFHENLLVAGTAIYTSAVIGEFLAEIQRNRFKARKQNAGRLCTTGFWAVTRHINYTMNVVFGFAYGLATGGWWYTGPTTGMYLTNFITNAIPSHEAYCRGKYGQEYVKYEQKVPWRLIPFIY